jgi:hypothetical protein
VYNFTRNKQGRKNQNTMKNTAETSYARMGMAAMLPGMQRAAEILQNEIEKFKALLSDDGTTRPQIYNASRISKQGEYWESMTLDERRAEMVRRGMKSAKKLKNYWANMTPEQRRAEMNRRVAVRAGLAEPQRKKLKEKRDTARLEEKRRKDREGKARRRAEKKAAA